MATMHLSCLRWLLCLAVAAWVTASAAPLLAADAPLPAEAEAEADGDTVVQHHHGPASSHPLSIDPDLAIVTLAVFVLLLLVLTKFAWKPIMAGLAKRESAVADDVASAVARRAEAEQLLAQYQLKLEQASGDVRAMLDGAKREAEVMKHAILEEASKAAAAEKDQATQEILAAKDVAIAEMGTHSANIAFRVASGALGREVNPADHQDLVAQAGMSGAGL